MPQTTPPTDQFSEILSELTNFQDYFTDDSKINELAEYIHAETGVNKVSIRFAIKRIAPLLASTVGVPMLNKLHGKLSQYTWYLTVSQRLIDSLKTMSDKSLDLALDIPSNENLESLITDKAKWANLKPEYQGLVQLLLGQNSLYEGLDSVGKSIEEALQHQLDNLVHKLSFDLDLKTPDFLISQTQDADAGSAQWLTYGRRQARLIGRNSSLQQLDEFFDQETSFVWWAITGSGGVGKSRLALDAIEHRQTLWDVGFLSHSKLKKDDALSGWQPQYPTIIVIDYAAEYPESIRDWIDYFIQHKESFDFPVRLLILEREHKSQQWWERLVDGSSDALNRRNHLFTQAPHELEPLTISEQRATLESFLESLSCDHPLPDDENTFWENLNALSNKGCPLFIGMVAVAIANHGMHQLRNWNQEELLNYVLKHEQSAWERQLQDFAPERRATIYQLLAFTTATAGLNFDNTEQLYKRLKKCELGVTDTEIEKNIEAVYQLTGSKAGYLQPDIFGEYFVLQQWKYKALAPNGLLKKRLLAAQKLYPENTYAFLSRAAVDYPKDETPFRWWSLLDESAKNSETKSALSEVSFGIIGQISLHGHYVQALTHWLPPLCKSEDPKNKARALSEQGVQNLYIGNYLPALDLFQQSLVIQQEIGDKSEEGTTLNNISQVYKARGDYETALSYLEQSLAIQQKVGNKPGIATTLNNMATTTHARGDYETALSYIQQSLAIQQEVGNKLGIGTALNNISQVFSARGDHETALNYLQQSLTIQQKIGNKLGEAATLGNISSIFTTRGNYETALSYLRQSLAIQQKIGHKSGEGSTLNKISNVFRILGQYETALSCLQQSLVIQQEIGDKCGVGNTLSNISQIFQTRGEFVTALSYLRKSLVIQQEIGDKSGKGTTLNYISQVFQAWGDNRTALSYLKQSLSIQQEIGDKYGEGTTLGNISGVFKDRGDYVSALNYLQRSLVIQQEVGDIAGEYVTRFNIGHIQKESGQTNEALKSWANVYKTAKRKGFAQVLNALQELAEHMELPGGLEGWEAFLEKDTNKHNKN